MIEQLTLTFKHLPPTVHAEPTAQPACVVPSVWQTYIHTQPNLSSEHRRTRQSERAYIRCLRRQCIAGSAFVRVDALLRTLQQQMIFRTSELRDEITYYIDTAGDIRRRAVTVRIVGRSCAQTVVSTQSGNTHCPPERTRQQMNKRKPYTEISIKTLLGALISDPSLDLIVAIDLCRASWLSATT